MKLLQKAGMALMVIAIIGFASCNLDGSGDDGIWNSYTIDAAFYVDNFTTYDLVAFKGSVNSSTLIGGVRAGQEYHGFQRNPALFKQTEAFPVVLVTREQYEQYSDNLNQLNNSPFTRIFVFYNHGGDNSARTEISGSLGGDNKLLVQNNTKYDVELRLNGTGGETLGFAPKQMQLTTLALANGDHNIYPVFRFYNPVRAVASTIYPKNKGGNPWFMPLFADGGKTLTIDVKDALDNTLDDFSLGAAWIVIQNQTAGAIAIEQGGVLQTDGLGNRYFNSGDQKVITVKMSTVGNGFAPNQPVSGFKAGPDNGRVVVEDQNGNTTFTLESDMMYTMTVTGNHNDDNLKAVLDMENGVHLELDDILED